MPKAPPIVSGATPAPPPTPAEMKEFHDTLMAALASDERRGLPSASSIERLALCPGSRNLCDGLPELVTPEMQEWAESGDRVHLALYAPSVVDLSKFPEEQEVVDRCAAQRDELVAKIFPGGGHTIVEEKRLWLKNRGLDVLSGQCDFAAYELEGNKVGLVIDYKSSRGDITPADNNLQLMTLAVLLLAHVIHETKGDRLHKIYVAIVQPLVSKEPALCCYEADDLIKACQHIYTLIAKSQENDAPLVPGEKQCRFCPAKLKCPKTVEIVKKMADTLSKHCVTKVAEVNMELIGNPDLDIMLVYLAIVDSLSKAAKALAKTRLTADPTSLKSWTLKPGDEMREVSDPAGLFQALYEAGLMDKDTFLKSCVTVGIGDLTESLRLKNSLTMKDAKKAVQDHGAPFITKTRKQPSLERITCPTK